MIIDVGEWDRELTPREVIHLDKYIAGARVLLSLQRKIEFLEALAKDAARARQIDVKLFQSRAALRRWNDADLKLWRWGDGTIDKWSEKDPRAPEGPNEKLMARWSHAVGSIKELQKGKQAGLKKELQAAKLEIVALEKQVLDLMRQLDMLMRGD